MSEEKVTCEICPHHCSLSEGQTGLCRARTSRGGKVICSNYGRLTSIALDPIEKKPLAMFHPGSRILSVGSYGCNLHCPFCQNFEISMADSKIHTQTVPPELLTAEAIEQKKAGSIGIAFTFNEPLISYEYVRDCAGLAKRAGLYTVLVTNGMICEEPLLKLLPLIDAMNIDLKGYTQTFYNKLGGSLETVKNTIRLSAQSCHVEVTTLIIPGENDSDDEMREETAFLASCREDIPLHISRFFPRYHMTDRDATPVDLVYHLRDTASENLKYVFTGNC